jgi:hypothetical protein
MDSIITTIALAFVFIALGIAALAIGYLVTGRSKMRGNKCGTNPHDKSCDTKTHCDLCGKGEEDDES